MTCTPSAGRGSGYGSTPTSSCLSRSCSTSTGSRATLRSAWRPAAPSPSCASCWRSGTRRRLSARWPATRRPPAASRTCSRTRIRRGSRPGWKPPHSSSMSRSFRRSWKGAGHGRARRRARLIACWWMETIATRVAGRTCRWHCASTPASSSCTTWSATSSALVYVKHGLRRRILSRTTSTSSSLPSSTIRFRKTRESGSWG
mmetsp:Transcript_67052/g.218300  ORF Transcript_67052/g.218300 Transcript_67052/m.218300 type:complete len:202 (+) Transcript_67052:265-870(+)